MPILGVLRDIAGNRSVAAALVAFSCFTIVLHGSWVGVLLFAFARGGVGEVGLVALGVLIPASLAGPFVAVLFDRFRPSVALASGFLIQASALVLTAILVIVDAHWLAVYAAMALVSLAKTASRPTLSTALPRIVRSPAELVAANSVVGVIEMLGIFLGPALAGVILLAADEIAVLFICAAALMGLATIVSLPIRTVADAFVDDIEPTSVFRQVAGGLTLLRRDAGPRNLVLLLAVGRFVAGVLEVAVVAVALERLGRSEATAGLMASCIGIGGLCGAALSFLLVGQRRLSAPVAAAVCVLSVPLLLIAATTSLPIVVVLLAVSGAARPVLEVAGRTLLQSLSAEDTLARIFGFVEGVSLLALACGSLGYSQVAVLTSVPIALVIFGLVPILALALVFSALRSIDADRPEVPAQRLDLVRRVPIFAPLPPFSLEQMLLNMAPQTYPPDHVVFSEGDDGDLIHIVADGSAVVELADGPVPADVGDFFGEIALIREVPRTATVRAGPEGLETLTLTRDIFLDAIGGAGRSRSRTDQVIRTRLGEAG